MASRTKRRDDVKTQEAEETWEACQVVRDQVEELAREGARQMLVTALQEEVDAYLGRERYEAASTADTAMGLRRGD